VAAAAPGSMAGRELGKRAEVVAPGAAARGAEGPAIGGDCRVAAGREVAPAGLSWG
jgi:hypothetical protein